MKTFFYLISAALCFASAKAQAHRTPSTQPLSFSSEEDSSDSDSLQRQPTQPLPGENDTPVTSPRNVRAGVPLQRTVRVTLGPGQTWSDYFHTHNPN